MLCLKIIVCLKLVPAFQVFQHHKIIPLSILGRDQQNLGKILSDFKFK